MTSLFNNKKGNIFGLAVIGIVLFVIGTGLAAIYTAIDDVSDDMITDFEEKNNTQSKGYIEDLESDFPTIFDAAIIFLFIGMWMSVMITSFFLDTHPIFFVISLIAFVCILFGMIVIGNSYISLMSTDAFLTIESKFPMSYWLISHWFMTAIFTGGSILIALFARRVGE